MIPIRISCETLSDPEVGSWMGGPAAVRATSVLVPSLGEPRRLVCLAG